MTQAKFSAWRPIKPILLALGLATTLAACHVHDSGRRGPVHYSQNHYWNDRDRDRDRDRHHWRRDRDRDDDDRRHWRRDRRHGDRDRDRHRRRRGSDD